MKVVNPIGKKTVAKSDSKAYACNCGTGNASLTGIWGYGHAGCSHCGCGCGGENDIYAGNSSGARSAVTF